MLFNLDEGLYIGKVYEFKFCDLWLNLYVGGNVMLVLCMLGNVLLLVILIFNWFFIRSIL